MAEPYTLTAISDVPLSESDNDLLDGQRGRTLTEPSLVEIYLNAEDVDITMGVTIGAVDVLSAGSRVTLEALVGRLPSIQDDRLVSTFGLAGNEIIISARNADAAAANEARAIVKVTAVEDVDLMNAVRNASGGNVG